MAPPALKAGASTRHEELVAAREKGSTRTECREDEEPERTNAESHGSLQGPIGWSRARLNSIAEVSGCH